MMVYEKAIENYAKKTRLQYEPDMKDNIARYAHKIERMTATGWCPGDIICTECPVYLANEMYPEEVKACNMSSDDEKKRYVALECKEV